MTKIGTAVLQAAMIVGLALPEYANAVEFNGAWTVDAGKCDEVFVRRGRAKQIGFAEFSGVHGGGFIIDAG